MEMEELKDELSNIVISKTPSGRERWDTPEVKLATGRKGRMRKDRYSALVIANMIARTIYRELPPPTYQSIGRIAGKTADGAPTKDMYMGPEWAKGINEGTCFAIRRKH